MTKFKGIPPRKLISKRNNSSCLPTIARTVSTSDRSGKYNIDPFNDTRTLVFTTGSSIASDVKSPLGLSTSMINKSISFINLSQATSSINFDGISSVTKPAVVSGISDIFLETQNSTQNITPFTEHKLYEQGNTSDFYTTGSDIDNFTSKLSDKTIIRLTYQQATKYTLTSENASIAYYNPTLQTFVQIGNTTAPVDAFSYNGNDEGAQPIIADITTSGAINYGHDARLFGPLGNMIASGSYTNSYNCVSNLLGQYASANMINAMSQYSNSSVTTNPDYNADSSYRLNLSGVITQPFLVEKIIIELPLSASSNWLNDTTTLNYCGARGQDMGGPCITVSLLNQFNKNHRDVIASGTIIPIGDNISEFYTSAQSPYCVSSPHGFASFARPTVVVSGTNNFSGNLILEMQPAISNGVFCTAARAATNSISTIYNSRLRMINKFGHAMSQFKSGRNFTGNEFVTGITPARYQNVTTGSGQVVDVLFFNTTIATPYIIQQTDQLILAISKYRSVITNPVSTLTGGDRTQLSASHTVAVDVGNINVTLYGSLISDKKEFHFCRNEPLTTNNINEALSYNNHVYDQYDLAPLSSFSGSYIDVYISGTITSSFNSSTSRKILGSSVSGTTTKSITRFVKITSRETIFDSYIPSPAEIQLTDNADIVALRSSVTSSISVLMFPLRSDGGANSITAATTGDNITENSKWPFAFAFENRYNSLKRGLFKNNVVKSTSRYTLINAQDTFTANLNAYSHANAIMRVKSNVHYPLVPSIFYGTSSIEHLQNSSPTTDPPENEIYFGRKLSEGVFNKGFFGFGDQLYNQPRYIENIRLLRSVTSVLTGAYNHEFHTNAEIRGWKYGIFDGNPRQTNMMVSRTHHGHLRDIFEQRQFTKVSMLGITPNEAVVTYRSVVTSSLDAGSNAHVELTSSTPYFDGIVRN